MLVAYIYNPRTWGGRALRQKNGYEFMVRNLEKKNHLFSELKCGCFRLFLLQDFLLEYLMYPVEGRFSMLCVFPFSFSYRDS